MINRDIQILQKEIAISFPVATINGPHQPGKTLLVKQTYPRMNYISLEELDIL